MKYSIIIPTYNHVDLLKSCLESVIKYTDLSDSEIIVVANGCTDGTESYLTLRSETCLQLKVIWVNEPLGYTVATNKGILASWGKYIVFLNNDTVLLEQPVNHWLDILEEPFKYEKVGVTGPMKEKTETIDRKFILFFCAMTSRKCIDEIGLLDEAFSPGYGEDSAYCFEAENKGYKIVQVPDDEDYKFYGDKRRTGNFPIYHAGNETFKDHPDPELIHRNNAIIKERYGKKHSIEGVGIKSYDFEGFGGTHSAFYIPTDIVRNPDGSPKKANPKYTNDIPEGLFQSPTMSTEKEQHDAFMEAQEGFYKKDSTKDAYGFPLIDPNSTWMDEQYKNLGKATEESFAKMVMAGHPTKTINIERAKTIDGFMSDNELQWLAEKASTAKVFIEVGSWHGRSSRAIADNLPEGGVLYCVDTWNGSANEQDTHHASAKDRIGDGAFLWFLESCFDLVKNGTIIPIRMDSINASDLFYKRNIKADVIFIDANHEYAEVKKDIIYWENMLNKGGVICGHDYGTPNQELDGVTRAVNDLFPNVQMAPYTSIWIQDYSKELNKQITFQPLSPNSFDMDKMNEVWNGEFPNYNTTTAKDPSMFAHAIAKKESKGASQWLPTREPKVFDCFPFNNELDILEIRFNELYDVVDRFIIVEARYTHSGNPKELVFHNNLKRFEKFLNKVTYLVIEEFPDFKEDENWSRERYQRDYIMNGLKDCQRDDIIIISDCDEITTGNSIKWFKKSNLLSVSLSMDLYYYNFNTKAVDKWEEAKIARYSLVKAQTPCGIRYSTPSVLRDAGWHFSYFGNVYDIVNKIEATAHQEYNTPNYKNIRTLKTRMENGEDVFGRNLKFTHSSFVHGKDLPSYIVNTNNEFWDKYTNPNNS